MINFNQLNEDNIQQRLAVHRHLRQEESFNTAFLPGPTRPAAVLVPLLQASLEDNRTVGWHVLLTKRSNHLVEHSGQVAFPGGGSEPLDSTPEDTALREAQEEIGLNPQDVKVLGKLDSLITITNFRVSPVVGVIPWPYHFRLAEGEVDRVFTIPLSWLADPSHYEIRQRIIPPPYSYHLENTSHPVIYFQQYDGEMLWGVSAEITIRLLKTLSS